MKAGELYNIKASEIARKPDTIFSPNEHLSKIIGKMEPGYVLIGNKKLSGFLKAENLVRHMYDPIHTKIEKYMEFITEVDDFESMPSLCFRRNNGNYVMACNSGIISDAEIIGKLTDLEDFKNIKAARLSNRLIYLNAEDSLDRARALMIKEKISRIGVVDENKVVGILRSQDVLRAGIQREKIKFGEYATEKEKLWDVPIKDFMFTELEVLYKGASLFEAVKKMVHRNILEVFIKDKVYRILTSSDIIKFLSNIHFKKVLEVKLIGVDVPEEKLLIYDYVEKALKGKLRFLKRPTLFEIKYKKISKTGYRHLYELKFRLECEYGILNAKSQGWDLLTVLEQGLKHLERMALEKKKRSENKK